MYPDGNGQTGLSSPEINGHDTVYEDEAEHKGPIKAFTTPERDMPTLGKRKSGTYWRRKSSLTLNAEARNGYFPQGVNENGTAAKRENETVSPALEETPVVARSWSPAPILPEVNLTQDSRFLDADDMFKNIG